MYAYPAAPAPPAATPATAARQPLLAAAIAASKTNAAWRPVIGRQQRIISLSSSIDRPGSAASSTHPAAYAAGSPCRKRAILPRLPLAQFPGSAHGTSHPRFDKLVDSERLAVVASRSVARFPGRRAARPRRLALHR